MRRRTAPHEKIEKRPRTRGNRTRRTPHKPGHNHSLLNALTHDRFTQTHRLTRHPVHDQAGGGLGGVDVSHPIPLVSGANPVSPKLRVRKAKRSHDRHTAEYICILTPGFSDSNPPESKRNPSAFFPGFWIRERKPSAFSPDSASKTILSPGCPVCPVCPAVSGDICPECPGTYVRVSEVSEDIKGHMSGCPVC